MNKQNKFSSDVRERAVRMVLEHRGEHRKLRKANEILKLANAFFAQAQASTAD